MCCEIKKVSFNDLVAIKLVVPGRVVFDKSQIRALQREASVHELFKLKKCEHAVQLVSCIDAVRIQNDVCWFVLEFLDGKDMDAMVHPSGQVETIILTISLLQTLSVSKQHAVFWLRSK